MPAYRPQSCLLLNLNKPFLLEWDASGKGLGAVLSQKQDDGHYHPIIYASRVMTAMEQRYHSNKKEFLALKWAVAEQFHEYLYPYCNKKMEFVVCTDNNPLLTSSPLPPWMQWVSAGLGS